MRRLPLILLTVALVAGAVWIWTQLLRDWRPVHPEIPLGDGTVLVVEGLTWGTNRVVTLESPKLARLKALLPPRLRGYFGGGGRFHQFSDSSPHLWLSRRSIATGNFVAVGSPDLRTVMANARNPAEDDEFHAVGSISVGSGQADFGARFEALDWRQDILRFRLHQGSSIRTFELPNPRRREQFPVWQPASLPQTNAADGYEFILSGIRSWQRTPARWQAQWSAQQAGRDVSGWFNGEIAFRDPTGNQSWASLPDSEPVWRVTLAAYPAGAFPFRDDQLFSLGRIPMPGPGKFLVLSPPQTTTNAGVHWVALMGPGSFEFRDGTNRVARTPGDGRLGNSSSFGTDHWNVTADTERPLLLAMLRGSNTVHYPLVNLAARSDRVILRVRAKGGMALNCTGQELSSSGDGTTTSHWMHFGFEPVDAGQPIDLDLVPVSPIRTEFTVAAPKAR